MLQQILCTIELSEKFGRDYPEFSLSIRFEIEKRLPLTKLELYLYQTTNSDYYIALKVQKVIFPEIYITCLGEFKEEELRAAFRFFEKTTNFLEIVENKKRIVFIADQRYVDVILPLLKENKLNHAYYPTVNYYQTLEQENLLLNSAELPLPNGYVLGTLTADDSKLITDYYPHFKGSGDEVQNKMKVTVFPSSAVRFNGELAAFQVVHANGMLNHLFVVPEHRRKGLGLIVELDLAKKLIREGHYVFKTVETFNESLITQTEKFPYWTRRNNSDGTANLRIYMHVWGEEITGKE